MPGSPPGIRPPYRRSSGRSAHECSRLPGHAKAGLQIKLPGIHEEAAHARQVGKVDDLVGAVSRRFAIADGGFEGCWRVLIVWTRLGSPSVPYRAAQDR